MAYDHHYNLFGVTLRLRTDSLRIHEEARLFLDAHRSEPSGTPRYVLEFRESATMPEWAEGPLRTCRGHEHQIIENGHGTYFSVAEGRAKLDPTRRDCRGYVFPKVNGRWHPRGTVPLLHPIVTRIMFAEGFLPLHAAAVSIRNRLLLLTGSKGAGKSTLAFKLHQRGCPLLGDDLLYLRRDSHGLLGGGHCQPIKLNARESRRLTTGLSKAKGPARVVRKTLFSLKQACPEQVNQWLPIMALVFLTQSTGGESSAAVWPDREVEVLHHLLGDSPLANTPGYPDRALDWFCAPGTCPLYLAHTHADADQTLDAILNALGPDAALGA